MLEGALAADPLGVLVAFGAGILSFLSPCVLPLVPGYLSLVSGLSAAELSGGAAGGVTTEDPVPARELAYVGAAAPALPPPRPHPRPLPPRRRARAPVVRGVLLFVAGFTVVFVALGASASGVHELLHRHLHALTLASGALVAALGALVLSTSLPGGVWSRLGPRVAGMAGWVVGERRFHVRPETFGAWAAPVLGMAFAFAWTPCIGPVLGAVLALAAARATLGGGVVLLAAYSLGLGVPFLATGLAFERLTGLYMRARRPLALVQVLAGAVLVAFGAILLAGDLGWLSAQFSALLDHLGLERLTVS